MVLDNRLDRSEEKAHHGIGKGCRNSDDHPPYNTSKELFPLSPNQTADELAVKFSNVKTEQSANNKEKSMANDQPQFLAFPTRYHNL